MARIAGTDIPNEKRIEISLTYLFGIGLTLSRKLLTAAKIDFSKRAKELSDIELASIQNEIAKEGILVEGELKRIIHQNIRRLQENGSYRGTRHKVGLPVRGQRTRSNSRTRKGKRKTVGGQKKKIAKK
jgi:small subunit ribosomal protein S13